MHHSSFSTSKRRAPLALAIVGAAAAAATLLLLLPANAVPRFAWLLALGACALVAILVAVRKIGHREDATRIEPTFETSILAFPPEPKLGPRPLRSH